MDDRAQVKLFSGDKGKTFIQIKPHLVAKHTRGAGTCAILLFSAVVKNMAH